MSSNRVVHSLLLSAIALVLGACASQPEASLLDTKFERAAKHYQKFQHEGQVVYCKKEKPSFSNIPAVQCLTESTLRLQVEDMHNTRNPVTRGGPPYVATVPGG
jgi:hypothetical protein